MATFNWSPNTYFTPTAYVANVGIDSQDGTANTPYRTMQKCKDTSKSALQISGIIREQSLFLTAGTVSICGDYCIIDRFGATSIFSSAAHTYLYNLSIINAYLGIAGNGIRTINCFFKKSLIRSNNYYDEEHIGSIFLDCTTNYDSSNGLIGNIRNCTYINSTITSINPVKHNALAIKYNIYKGCVLNISNSLFNGGIPTIDYCLFYNCSWKFGSSAVKTQSQIESETGLTGIAAVRKAHFNYYGDSINILSNCIVSDPLFNNPDFNDFTLQALSPARHAAYDGTYIGAKDVGFPTYAYANDIGYPNAFYNASKHANIIVANNSITLARNIDGSAVGSGYITEKPKKLVEIYELKGNQSSYIGADRNREMLDANSDIGEMASPISAGTALTTGVIYINEGGSVVYNSVTYPNRSRITAVDSMQSFTTTEGAVLHAVAEYPNRYTNLIRHKQTIIGTQIAAGTDVLTADSWYRVYNYSIVWDGKTVPAGDSFQAVAGKLSFSGAGVCVEEFNSTDVWHECIIDAPIKCRRVGNVASGAIDNGTDGKPLTNGHKEYYNATNKARAEFSIYAAYIQKHWVLNAKESK